MKAHSIDCAKNTVLPLAIAVILLGVMGCGKTSEGQASAPKTPVAKPKDDDFLKDNESATPEEKRFLQAGKPFAVALAGRKYDGLYKQFSSHARAHMSMNQFDPAKDDGAFEQNEKNPMTDVTAEKFAELMKKVEELHGMPRGVRMLSVYSTDHGVLTRTSKEQTAALDSMFAIGAMPESTPMDIRRASLRGQIKTELTPEELEKAAKDAGVTVEDLKKNPDFEPYFNFKIVLVEEGGQLKVGYFEFLPPSMMD